MTICREWSLVKYADRTRYGKPLLCRSWSCDFCAPQRRRQLIARAANGNPTRFITLTVNPSIGTDPADRLDKLANAWRIIVKRLRRLHPNDEIEYLAVVEETKQGEPHLHILVRSPFIPQRLLSSWMGEITGAPVVDIRSVKNASHAARYVAKYIAKAPKQFGSRKRYWSSKDWEPPYTPGTAEGAEPSLRWSIDRRPLVQIINEWIHDGYAARHHRADTIIGFFIDDPPEFRKVDSHDDT